VVHQEKGGTEHLTFSSGDVGEHPLPRRGVGEVGEAGLEGGAEQEELVLRGEGKGRERSHQTLNSRGTRAAVGLDTGVGAITQTRHTARLRNAKRSRIRHPKPTHGARDRPKPAQPRAGRDRASESGQRHASRCTRPTDTGTRCPGKGQRQAPGAPPRACVHQHIRMHTHNLTCGQLREPHASPGP
jgi:hypothetical protein